MRMRRLLLLLVVLALAACGPSKRQRQDGLAAFATVQQVFQHPRCQNCHIPGDQPLQFDQGLAHAQGVLRGPEGNGPPGLPCSTCHGAANLPESYGSRAPPGAPNWHLPPPGQRMVFIDLSPAELCETIKDPKRNGNRTLDAMIKHVAEDPLVGWGWHPGGERAPVPIAREEVAA